MYSVHDSESTYMIVVEEEHHQKTERQSYKYPFDIESPKLNHPITRLRGLECTDCRYSILLSPTETSREVGEPNPKKGREDEGVIGKDATYPWFPDGATTNLFETINGAEEQYRNYDGQVTTLETRYFKKVDEFLYSFNCTTFVSNRRTTRSRSYVPQ
jgi:hypothetical protein